MKPEITLHSRLSIKHSLLYPVQHADARREVLIGGLWLLVPVFGWILNMGHRIRMTHRMQHGERAWPAWCGYGDLLKHGTLTFLGMLEYHAPAMIVIMIAYLTGMPWLYVLGAALWLPATLAVPGYMTHYCYSLNPKEIFNPLLAYQRVQEGGAAYWKAWGIVLLGLALSFTGLLLAGVGFLFTSVWFWQSAGFSFATVFSEKFDLIESKSAAHSKGAISA